MKHHTSVILLLSLTGSFLNTFSSQIVIFLSIDFSFQVLIKTVPEETYIFSVASFLILRQRVCFLLQFIRSDTEDNFLTTAQEHYIIRFLIFCHEVQSRAAPGGEVRWELSVTPAQLMPSMTRVKSHSTWVNG